MFGLCYVSKTYVWLTVVVLTLNSGTWSETPSNKVTVRLYDIYNLINGPVSFFPGQLSSTQQKYNVYLFLMYFVPVKEKLQDRRKLRSQGGSTKPRKVFVISLNTRTLCMVNTY